MNETPQLNFSRRLLSLISRTIQHIVITIACGLCALLVCVWFARLSTWLELAAHFSAHALIATLLVIPILWLTAHRRTAVVCCFVAIGFTCIVQPWHLIPFAKTSKPDALRVLSWNVLASNEDFDSIVDFIRGVDPDVLVLIEVRPDLLERAPWLTEHYPISKVIPNWGGAGIAVFCREAEDKYSVDLAVHNFYSVDIAAQNFATRVMPSIVATFTSPDHARKVDLIATHTFSPTPPQRALLRDKQLRKFLEWSNQQNTPQCLVGDLNTTPWTQSFGELQQAGFRDSRRGAGNCPSWPAWLGVAGIPIDHALSRGECSITDRRVHFTNAGSDHCPIDFKLSF